MESQNEKITRVDIETMMKNAYIDYAMSVIVLYPMHATV